MNIGPGPFLKYCATAVVAFSILVAAFNRAMDPYLLFHTPREAGLNARKPASDEQQYLIKAYEVLRQRPRTLILGSSNIALGLTAQSSVWPEERRPVYNLGLTNSSTSIAYRYLQHVTAQQHVGMVVLGLEFRDFLASSRKSNAKNYESRLYVDRDGIKNRDADHQRLYDLLFATLSLDASEDSINTLAGNVAKDSSDIVDGDWTYRLYRHLTSKLGSYPLMILGDYDYSYYYHDAEPDPHVMEDVRKLLQLCHDQMIDVVVVLDPSHADELELFDLAGKWRQLESWKRDLTALVAQYAHDSLNRMELWDFYEYGRYSTESIPTDRISLRWFWTLSHYRSAVGDIMLRRVFGSDEEDFGQKLTPQNIESRLAKVRLQQQRYRLLQPQDAERIRVIYQLATSPRT